MPARDSREGQTDYAALPEEHRRYVERLQQRQADMGLEVTVNRGRVYGDAGSDAAMADVIEDRLAVDEVGGGEEGATYKITVNRGGGAASDPKAAAEYARSQQSWTSDQVAAPGSPPIVHDAMTEEQRKQQTRRALAAYSDRRMDADEQVEGEARPGVVMARPGRTQAPHVTTEGGGDVVFADRPVEGAPGPVLATSDTAREALRAEQIGMVEARKARDLDAEAKRVREALPERSEDAGVDDQGRTTTSTDYRERMAAVRAAKQRKAEAKAEPKASQDRAETEGAKEATE